MFRIDQDPHEAEQYGQDGYEISKTADACSFRIQEFTFACNDDKPTVLHSRCLARAQHEKQEINCDEREEAYGVNAKNAFVRGKTLRRLAERCSEKNYINGRNNAEIG